MPLIHDMQVYYLQVFSAIEYVPMQRILSKQPISRRVLMEQIIKIHLYLTDHYIADDFQK
jgi:isochorismate hydrolase